MKLCKPLVIFDLETTGIWIEKDRIIEIAILKIHVDGKKEIYRKLINPNMTIPPLVVELTGISNIDVSNAPSFKEVCHEVINFIGDSDLAGFNIERFDLPVLLREIEDAGHTLQISNRKIIDAQKIYHINEKRDLKAAYKFYCGKPLKNAHSALADAKATYAVLQVQLKKYGEGSELLETLDKFSYPQSAESYDSEGKFRWWNGELYITFGKHINKSLNELVKNESDYLKWILSADFSGEIKNLVSNALKNELPNYIAGEE